MKKSTFCVLIYKARALIGESMRLFCDDLGIKAIVAEKGDEIPKDCAIYLVCASSAKIAKDAFAELQAQGIDNDKFRWIRTYVYKPSLRPLLAEYFTKESVIALWLAGDIESFHKQLFSLASAHIANRPKATESFALRQNMARNSHQSVFAALHSASSQEVNCIPYPGFNIHVEGDRKLDDKNFYLIEPIEWELLRNRHKDTKLIAMMGNSALRVPYLPVEDTIPRLLQKQLQDASQKIIVLNFGIAGYTVYEQMMFYNAIVSLLRPEIVVSMFGGTDWRTGTMNDTVLLKDFQICYTPGFYEYNAKKLLQSSIPLFTELQIPNPEISDDDVNTAILTRLQQFHDIVRGGGGNLLRLSNRCCHAKGFGQTKNSACGMRLCCNSTQNIYMKLSLESQILQNICFVLGSIMSLTQTKRYARVTKTFLIRIGFIAMRAATHFARTILRKSCVHWDYDILFKIQAEAQLSCTR